MQIFSSQGRKSQKLGMGEALGELYLLEEGCCNYRAEAASDCELLVLRRLRLQQLVREHGASAMKVATEHMWAVARLAAKKIVSTPMLSVRCLQVGGDDKLAATAGKQT